MILRSVRSRALVGLLSLVVVSACSAGQKAKPAKPNMDDRDVIQTALLSFFKAEFWHSRDWKTTKYVVLRPQLRSRSRDFYAQLLQARIDALKEDLKVEKKPPVDSVLVKRDSDRLARLVAVQKRKLGTNKYVPPPVRALYSYVWDKRILLTYKGSTVEPADPKYRLERRYGRVGVYASVSLPVYAPDGNSCILDMSLPWSIHSASATFVLRRVKGRWSIVFGDAALHV